MEAADEAVEEAPSKVKSAGADEPIQEVAPPPEPEEKKVSLDEYLTNKEAFTLDLSSLRIGKKGAAKEEAVVEEEAAEGEEEEYYEEGVEGEEYAEGEEYYEEEEAERVVEFEGVRSPPPPPCLATIHQRTPQADTRESAVPHTLLPPGGGSAAPCRARAGALHVPQSSLPARLQVGSGCAGLTVQGSRCRRNHAAAWRVDARRAWRVRVFVRWIAFGADGVGRQVPALQGRHERHMEEIDEFWG